MPDVAPVLIDGAWISPRARATREIRNPATLELLGVAPECGTDDVAAAVGAAARAQPAWWRVPGVEKANYLRTAAAKIRASERELSTLMARETGKPLIEAVDCIEWVAACFDYYAEVGRRSYGTSIPPVAAHQINFTIKEPYGVVAAIVPFNFPLLLMAWKVAPALAAGNALVCKPPHQNPLSNLLMARCFDGLPPGVVNVITGGPETGAALVRHPRVDLIAFTGSVAAGRRIAAQVGQELKKVNLELGSVVPFIVFEDADLDVAVPGVAWPGSSMRARSAPRPSGSTWPSRSRASSPSGSRRTSARSASATRWTRRWTWARSSPRRRWTPSRRRSRRRCGRAHGCARGAAAFSRTASAVTSWRPPF